MTIKLATKFAPQPSTLETAVQAGFRHAELWLDGQVLLDAPSIIQLAQAYPLEYTLHFPNRLDDDPKLLERAIALYRALQCRCMVIHQPMYAKFAEALRRLDPDLRLAVENHRLTPERLIEWAQTHEHLTLDVEHLWKFTHDDCELDALLDHLRSFLARFAGKLRHVHLPGYWPGFKEHRPMYCARDMIFPVLSQLAAAHFDGFVVSEIECEYQNIHEMRMDVLLVEAWREHCDRNAGTPIGS